MNVFFRKIQETSPSCNKDDTLELLPFLGIRLPCRDDAGIDFTRTVSP